MKIGGLIVLVAAAVLAQDQDTERRMWSTEFVEQRPPVKQSNFGKALRKPAPPAMVGVTLWRFRPAKSEDAARVLIQEEVAGEKEMTLERVNVSTGVHEGDHVRISIESARSGYLYVISREQYRDGTLGQPYLIFPSRRILAGDNHVQAGRIVDIPEWDNARPYFTLKKSRPDEVSETLTIVLAPTPIENMIAVTGPLPVSTALLQEWKRKWGAAVKMLDATAGNAAMTPAEKASSVNGAPLGPQDPAPATLFRVDAAPGAGLLVSVPIRLLQ
jgi:hypothetical protein